VDLPASGRISVPRRTQVLRESLLSFVYGAVTLYGLTFQKSSTTKQIYHSHMRSPTTPLPCRQRFGLLPFRSPLLRESFLFLGLLRCFSSPRSLCYPMCSGNSARALTSGGFPHSDILGYSVCTRLPEAYRSVPRPSSAFGAKASTVRP
jgi:hypothetical protein